MPSLPLDRRAPGTVEKNRFRTRRLSAAAVALAVSSASRESSAAVIPLDVDWQVGNTISIDGRIESEFTITSTTDMWGDSLYFEAAAGMMTDDRIEFSFIEAGTGMDKADYLTLFPDDQTVVSSFLDYSNIGYLEFESNTDSTWQNGDTAYAGFRFNDGTQLVYGWMEVQFTDASTLNITQLAYQNDGTSILAGETPEPGTGVLLGLGLVGLGVKARQARRRAKHDRGA